MALAMGGKHDRNSGNRPTGRKQARPGTATLRGGVGAVNRRRPEGEAEGRSGKGGGSRRRGGEGAALYSALVFFRPSALNLRPLDFGLARPAFGLAWCRGAVYSPRRRRATGTAARPAASLAQSVEQLTLNQRVEGSSPSGGTSCVLHRREGLLRAGRYCGGSPDRRLASSDITDRSRWPDGMFGVIRSIRLSDNIQQDGVV